MRFTSTMMRDFRREGPPLLRVRRALSWVAAPPGWLGAMLAPVAIFGGPFAAAMHSHAAWLRGVGVGGGLGAAALCAWGTASLAGGVRRQSRSGVIDVDSVMLLCGLALTPVVLGLVFLVEVVGLAGSARL